GQYRGCARTPCSAGGIGLRLHAVSTDADTFDFVVIGSGPGGEKAAIQAAKAGRRVAIVEREREVGGACVYTGTIPSKTLREAALTLLAVKRSARFLECRMTEQVEVATLMNRLDEVLGAHAKF